MRFRYQSSLDCRRVREFFTLLVDVEDLEVNHLYDQERHESSEWISIEFYLLPKPPLLIRRRHHTISFLRVGWLVALERKVCCVRVMRGWRAEGGGRREGERKSGERRGRSDGTLMTSRSSTSNQTKNTPPSKDST